MKITGEIKGDKRKKIELESEFITDRVGYCTDPVIYTNVLQSVANQRRADHAEKQLRWGDVMKDIQSTQDPTDAAKGLHSLVVHDGKVVLCHRSRPLANE